MGWGSAYGSVRFTLRCSRYRNRDFSKAFGSFWFRQSGSIFCVAFSLLTSPSTPGGLGVPLSPLYSSVHRPGIVGAHLVGFGVMCASGWSAGAELLAVLVSGLCLSFPFSFAVGLIKTETKIT